MGIAAALDAQARRVPIPVSVEAGGIGRYPKGTGAAIYFCTLEALSNAAKHADASRASIRLSENNAGLRFEVADDGRSFDPATTQQGTGLQDMADRIDALGGTSTSIQVPARAPGSTAKYPPAPSADRPAWTVAPVPDGPARTAR